MAKKRRPGRCVHCLQQVPRISSDHVLPESWYPDNTPEDMELWQAPSCHGCNGELGRLERFLLACFVLSIDPEDPAIAGLSEKVHRAMDPRCGKNTKDSMARAQFRAKVMRRIRPAAETPAHAIIPGFGPHEGVPIAEAQTIGVRPEELFPVVEKIVRGLTHVHGGGAYIEETHKITIRLEREEDLAILTDAARRYGERSDRGAGIHVVRAAPREDPSSGVFRVTIWERFGFFAIVAPKDQPVDPAP